MEDSKIKSIAESYGIEVIVEKKVSWVKRSSWCLHWNF